MATSTAQPFAGQQHEARMVFPEQAVKMREPAQIFSQIVCSLHILSRRQALLGLEYRSGRRGSISLT